MLEAVENWNLISFWIVFAEFYGYIQLNNVVCYEALYNAMLKS